MEGTAARFCRLTSISRLYQRSLVRELLEVERRRDAERHRHARR